MWIEGKKGRENDTFAFYNVGVLSENIYRGRKRKIERQRAGWGWWGGGCL